MRGSKPAARHASTSIPSAAGAIHGSSASAARSIRARPASRCPAGRSASIGSSASSTRRSPSCSRRGARGVLEAHRRVEAAGCDGVRERIDAALLAPPTLRARGSCRARAPRARPARSWRARSGTRRAGARGRSPATSASIWPSASASRAASASACSSSSSPAGVGTVPARPRTSSAVPSSRSSAATWCETAGWLRASASAARENERWRATARNVSSRRGIEHRSDYRYA